MTRRFVVSLPATVHGQHSPTVFSEVYLHLLCYVSVFVCTISVSGVCVCVVVMVGVHVCTRCVSVLCLPYVCLFRVYLCTLRSCCVFLI